MLSAEASLERHFPHDHDSGRRLNFGKLGAAQISGVVAATVASLGAIALNTATGFFIAFSAIILSFFFLLNDTQIAEGFASMFPPTGARRRASSRPK